MPDTAKYRNTMNMGREDVNKHAFKIGQIVHTARQIIANRYDYCDYPEHNIPAGSRARITGIKQTSLNAKVPGGIGDVYIDFELVDHVNSDGVPVTCGNRHGWTVAEANPDFALCPDGSGEPGYIRGSGMRDEGLWHSLECERIEDHPVHGYVQFRYRKVVDPNDCKVA